MNRLISIACGAILTSAALISAADAAPRWSLGWRDRYDKWAQAEMNGQATVNGLKGDSFCRGLRQVGIHNIPVAPIPTGRGGEKAYRVPSGTPKYHNSLLDAWYYCPVPATKNGGLK